MNDINELIRRFATLRGVTIEPGLGGLTRVAITTAEAEAHIYLHGAHVTHYQPRGGRDLLFLSANSVFAPGKPIRGGVPIVFPWFGPKLDDPTAPMHGFARLTEWDLVEIRRGTDGSIAVVMELSPTSLASKIWPHEFKLRYAVTVGATLDLSLQVQNPSAVGFSFEEALHTYLAVGDVRTAHIDGLTGRDFLDKTDMAKRKTQTPGDISIIAETDRVYLNTPDAVGVADPHWGRRLMVEKEGSNTTVLWNPWIAKAKAMADFGDEEWPAMLCVETANAAENAVVLPAGQNHRMRARLSAGPIDNQANRSTKQWEMADQRR